MEGFNPGEVAQKIMDAVKKEYKDLNKLNVMILGKTGVGKSTLINNIQQITEIERKTIFVDTMLYRI